MGFQGVEGARLRYELTGSGDVPLVLVHGSWGAHTNWDLVAPGLAKSFRVLAYDRRGHAQSEAREGQGSILEDVADLGALIEALELAPAWMVSNSFGGNIVFRLAAQRPELFRGIVAHEPPLMALAAGNPAAAAALGTLGETIGEVVGLIAGGRHAEAAERFMAAALAPDEWKALPPSFQRTAAEVAPTFLDEVQDPDALDFDGAWITDFDRPVLLTLGERSPGQYAPVLDALASRLPRAERLTFPKMGHLPHVTHPEAYVRAVTQFVRAHGD